MALIAGVLPDGRRFLLARKMRYGAIHIVRGSAESDPTPDARTLCGEIYLDGWRWLTGRVEPSCKRCVTRAERLEAVPHPVRERAGVRLVDPEERIAALQAQVEQLQAQVEELRAQLAEARVVSREAPVDGAPSRVADWRDPWLPS